MNDTLTGTFGTRPRIYARHPRTRYHALAPTRGACSGQGAFRPGHRLLHADPFAYMRRRLRAPDTANDLIQETLLRLLAYRDAPDIGNYALLMYRIAHNVEVGQWRTRRRRHLNAQVALDSHHWRQMVPTSTRSLKPAASCSTCKPRCCPHQRADAGRSSPSTASTASSTRE
ncbi:hypothetical protein HG421_19530 [Xanthomonas campestris pv. badrii]|uniref:RNA polymerase sigma-70 region 2 domain-containing protein n=1 Tax=Xanthomonas campestris pv. badrii TaxID=149696 RepID=A0A7Z2VDJ9_XANCA|nr:sigma factor [Xanthomonas campestris]QJD69666.1 hypothetical protein HG421_19530 [Xanthomonas campestris pv. badrii]